jgi:hypothetical protein
VDPLDKTYLRVRQFRCLKMEAEPASWTLCFIKNYTLDKVPKKNNSVSVLYIPSSDPTELNNAFRCSSVDYTCLLLLDEHGWSLFALIDPIL